MPLTQTPGSWKSNSFLLVFRAWIIWTGKTHNGWLSMTSWQCLLSQSLGHFTWGFQESGFCGEHILEWLSVSFCSAPFLQTGAGFGDSLRRLGLTPLGDTGGVLFFHQQKPATYGCLCDISSIDVHSKDPWIHSVGKIVISFLCTSWSTFLHEVLYLLYYLAAP